MRLISLLDKKEEMVDLVGRRMTIPLKERIMEIIHEAPRGTVFFFDFNEVGEVNGSGVHEIIVKPLEWLRDNYKTHDKFLVLTNLSKEYDHFYNIEITCNKEKVAVIAREEADYSVIGGKIGPALKEVLTLVYAYKQASAGDLAAKLNKKHTLLSTHLTKLYEERLIGREEEQLPDGGRQFIYKSLF